MTVYSNAGNDDGFMATEWIAAFAVLLIPTFILVVSLIQIPSRVAVGENAASQAALAYVGALDQTRAEDAAIEAANEVVSTQINGLTLDDETVQVIEASDGYCPGSEITVEVAVPIPVSINPFGGSAIYEFDSETLSSRATERIDDYAELANVGDMANGNCDV